MKRSYWASTTTEKLQVTLDELEVKGPEEFAQVITDLHDEIDTRKFMSEHFMVIRVGA